MTITLKITIDENINTLQTHRRQYNKSGHNTNTAAHRRKKNHINIAVHFKTNVTNHKDEKDQGILV